MRPSPSTGRKPVRHAKPILLAPLVTRSNDLVNARHDKPFSLMETRVIYACIATVDPRKPLDPNHLFRINVEKFSNLFPVSRNKAYEELRVAGERLFQQAVSVRHVDGSYKLTRLVSSAEYIHRHGCLEIRLTPSFAELVCNLRSHFTTVSLLSVSRMSSASTIRIYELLSEFSFIGRRSISVDNIKAFLGLQDAYPKFASFETKVLKPAVATINKETEIQVDYTLTRRGRTVTHIDFTIGANEVFNAKPKVLPPEIQDSLPLIHRNPSTWDKALAHLASTLATDVLNDLHTARVMQTGDEFELQFPNKIVLARVEQHHSILLDALQRYCVGRPSLATRLG